MQFKEKNIVNSIAQFYFFIINSILSNKQIIAILLNRNFIKKKLYFKIQQNTLSKCYFAFENDL